MRIGTGAVLLVLGAILYAAVDVDLPHINDDALGLIMLLGGLVTIVIAVITKNRPELGVSTGLLLIAAGAILAVAVRVELPHVATYPLGNTLICAGVLTLIATVGTVIGRRFRSSRRPENVRVDGPAEPEPGPILPPDLAVISDKDARSASAPPGGHLRRRR
jgi:peptidoglycan/LPS O-acetylase OafA/YrhL